MQVDKNPNLGQRLDDVPLDGATASHHWFSEARFGMFVHYGLYSIPGRGEWYMDFQRIPPAEYNHLAAEFTAEKFDANELVGLAKRAGARYVVFGARHHEGFCLFDSNTTDFTSIKTAAKRDLVKEYVTACHRAGLHVGLYYSIMSWQWPAIYSGPLADPEGWNAMVQETHEQVRELMSNYGQIDMLWYDGCVVPGVSDIKTIAKHWRSRELNAMVRELQPGIMINDRSCLPEDYSTPEQHLTLPPRGRAWELSMTINDHWGWYPSDQNFKSVQTLIEKLILCSRYDGNFLLNIGPQPDGSIPAPQVERMEEIGSWLAANGEAIYGTRRTAYTEGEHLLGLVSSHGKSLYFHIFDWPGVQVRVAGLTSPILSARLLSSGEELAVEQFDDGTATLRGLPAEVPEFGPTVIALEFAKSAPYDTPPQLLIEKDTGLFDPSEAPVILSPEFAHQSEYCILLEVPATGLYRIEFNVIANSSIQFVVEVDGREIPSDLTLSCIDYPDTLRLENVVLDRKEYRLVIRADDGIPFNLSAWRLQPIWRQIRSEGWLTIGAFASSFRLPGRNEEVLEAMSRVYPPQVEFDAEACYEGAGGKLVKWQSEKKSCPTVDFSRVGNGETGVCFARTTIVCPKARDAQILLGCDWWANLFVNGEEVRSCRDEAAAAQDGSWFSAWKPLVADVKLKKGENIFLVKCHQGRAGNWLSFYLNHSVGDEIVIS